MQILSISMPELSTSGDMNRAGELTTVAGRDSWSFSLRGNFHDVVLPILVSQRIHEPTERSRFSSRIIECLRVWVVGSQAAVLKPSPHSSSSSPTKPTVPKRLFVSRPPASRLNETWRIQRIKTFNERRG